MRPISLLVTALPGMHDAMHMEPTLEALYYKFAPCEMTLRTWNPLRPLFEHHPLVSDILVAKGVEPAPPRFDEHVVIPDPQKVPGRLPLIEKFAMLGDVSLPRRTPALFVEKRPADWNVIGVCSTGNDPEGWPDDITSRLLVDGRNAVDIEQPQNIEQLRDTLVAMSSMSLVVGADSFLTQAAAALNTRVVIGMTEEGEQLRKPHNVVVSRIGEDVYHKVGATWYEKRYPNFLNAGNAADFIKSKAKEYMKSGFIDMGANQWHLPNSIPIDKHNRAIVEEADDGTFNGLFSSHCLEHISDWKNELILWKRVIKEDGILFLYLPHPQCEPWHAHTGSWVGREHVWNPEPLALVRYLREALNFEILEYTSRPDPLWSFYVVARKRS